MLKPSNPMCRRELLSKTKYADPWEGCNQTNSRNGRKVNTPVWTLQKSTQLLASTLTWQSRRPQGTHRQCHGEQHREGTKRCCSAGGFGGCCQNQHSWPGWWPPPGSKRPQPRALGSTRGGRHHGILCQSLLLSSVWQFPELLLELIKHMQTACKMGSIHLRHAAPAPCLHCRRIT